MAPTRPLAFLNIAVAGALTLAAACLALACLVHAISAYDAADDPTAALWWDANQPEALAALAARRSDDAATPRDDRDASAYAGRALRASPLDVRALRVLALEAERRGDRTRAAGLMALAGKRSRRDTLTQLWLFAHAMQDGDADAASQHADMLLRRQPELAPLLFPPMEASLGQSAAERSYVAHLAEKPDWRRGFLADLSRGPDPAVARAVYTELAATRSPPTDTELGYLLARLVGDGNYRDAHAVWLLAKRGTPPGDGLYDGDFEGLGGPAPFNWRLIDDQGAEADLARTPDGRTALQVQSAAISTNMLAEQLLVLPPGTYRLSGEVLVDERSGGAAFSWSVTCQPHGDQIGAGVDRAVDPAVWRAFSIPLNVPPHGCEAQWLRLSSLAHDGFVTTSGWYRALRLQRSRL